jgi:hypothetical protein
MESRNQSGRSLDRNRSVHPPLQMHWHQSQVESLLFSRPPYSLLVFRNPRRRNSPISCSLLVNDGVYKPESARDNCGEMDLLLQACCDASARLHMQASQQPCLIFTRMRAIPRGRRKRLRTSRDRSQQSQSMLVDHAHRASEPEGAIFDREVATHYA